MTESITNRITPNPTESMSSVVRSLQVGEYVVYPLSRLATVRSTCSLVTLSQDKKFRTKSNKETRTVSVLRLK